VRFSRAGWRFGKGNGAFIGFFKNFHLGTGIAKVNSTIRQTLWQSFLIRRLSSEQNNKKL
jgi:hypothetical protein